MLPERMSVPLPFFVRAPVVLVELPRKVRDVPAENTSMTLVVFAVSVKLRSVDASVPVYCKVPPPRTRLLDALLEAPMLLLTPPFPIVEMLSVPALIVMAPV